MFWSLFLVKESFGVFGNAPSAIIRNTFDQQTVACTKQRLVQRSVLAELQQACRGAKENPKSVVGLEGIGTC